MSVYFRPLINGFKQTFFKPAVSEPIAIENDRIFKQLESLSTDTLTLAKDSEPPAKALSNKQIIENAIRAYKDPRTELLKAKGYLSPHPNIPSEMLWPETMPGEQVVKVRAKAQRLVDEVRASSFPHAPVMRTGLNTQEIIDNALKNHEDPLTALLAQKGHILPDVERPGEFVWAPNLPIAKRDSIAQKAQKIIDERISAIKQTRSSSKESDLFSDAFFDNPERVDRFIAGMEDVNKHMKRAVEISRKRLEVYLKDAENYVHASSSRSKPNYLTFDPEADY